MKSLLLFLADHLLPAIEKSFAEHEQEMQQALVNEVAITSEKLGAWLQSKRETKE